MQINLRKHSERSAHGIVIEAGIVVRAKSKNAFTDLQVALGNRDWRLLNVRRTCVVRSIKKTQSILNGVRLGIAALVQIELPHAVEECAHDIERILQLRFGSY